MLTDTEIELDFNHMASVYLYSRLYITMLYLENVWVKIPGWNEICVQSNKLHQYYILFKMFKFGDWIHLHFLITPLKFRVISKLIRKSPSILAGEGRI